MNQLNHDNWYRAIHDASCRDASVELIVTLEGADGRPMRKAYKSRVFAIEPDGTMLVERSHAAVMDNVLAVGDPLAVLAVHEGQRLMVESRVMGLVIHQVNPTLRLSCYRLRKGERVRVDQRRAFFRARSATSDHAQVTLRSGDTDSDWSMTGLLVNLGGGGLGVVLRADRQVLAQAQSLRRIIAEFHVASDGMDAEVVTRLAHIGAMDQDRLYLGLQFIPPEAKAGSDLQDRMGQYAAWLQRQALKNRRA